MPHGDHPKSVEVAAESSQEPDPAAVREAEEATSEAAEAMPKADEILAEHDEERPGRRLSGPVAVAITVLCAVLSVFVLYVVFWPLAKGSQFYLTIFLAAVLPLTFLCYRAGPIRWWRTRRGDSAAEPAHDNPGWLDWALAALSLAVAIYPLIGFDSFLERRQLPTMLDLVVGLVLTVLVLEACRRTTGWWLPAICLGFFAYAYYGGWLPVDWSLAHVGFNIDEIVPQLFMGTSGFYGTPLSVAATYIVLFTIYGAVLDMSGAGKFFIDLSFAAFSGRGGKGVSDGAGAYGHAGRVPARHRVGFGYGDRRQPRDRVMADPAPGGLSEGTGRRGARRRGYRRDPVATHARCRGVHHRRAAADELPDGARLRDRADDPLLRRDHPGDRDRRS